MKTVTTAISGPAEASDSRRLSYLSAAPRVSTNQHAEASGPRAHVLGVIQAFKTLGWEVHPYIVGDRVAYKFTSQSESKLEKSFFVRLSADVLRLVMGLWHSLQVWRELHGKVDWVYERSAVLQSLGWTLQSQKVPWILETNGLNFYEAKIERKSIVLSGIARILEFWSYRKCDVLICITEELKELIMKMDGIPAEKILVIPNGVDTFRFHSAGYAPKRKFDQPVIGFVGALVYWHRLDILLTALSELSREGVEFNLVVVGDGPMRKMWEAQAQELRLQDKVSFVGRVPWDEIPAYILGFDLGYVGNSPMEIGVMYHSPLKLYEYMAMARPVVASLCKDSEEMIYPGQHGYLFEPGNQEDLKRVLRLALQEKDRWYEMGLAARKRVIEKASWQTRVQDMVTGIERILEARHANSSPGC